MKTVITIGEILLRLSPKEGRLLSSAEELSAVFGGSEANVAVALSGFGERAVHLSALPKNPMGQAAENALRKYGVDTSRIVRTEGRMGLYFCEGGASVRAGRVVYDRARSAFAEAPASLYPLPAALEGATHLHLSGITPALGKKAEELTRLALLEAKERGLTTSLDLNFRRDLWSESKAKACFLSLLPEVDILIASSDGLNILGLENAGTDLSACARAAEILHKKFHLRAVALTVRESVSASFNRLAGVYFDGEAHISPFYAVDILDRVGGGDAFAAALLHAFLNGFSGDEAVSFAAAANAYKHTVFGDAMCVSAEEILSAARGETRIRR